ncbi:MAG TPA: IPT/TIG domain-containing protein, partial [Ktedonobacterales bacterium]|nr:IPT/TIG domain-containing protein [Ktedonobacterales bacterium]
MTSIQNLQTGGVRDALATQLATLQQSARQDLRSALPSLSWATRAHITTVLGQLGDRIPQVAQAGITGVTINGNYIWIITIDGSDFSSTALVLIDGQPVGTIVTRSSTTIVAHVPGNDLSAGSHVLGVGNPDDTASMLTGVSSAGAQDDHGG